jgi:predicted nucleotidyltransferase
MTLHGIHIDDERLADFCRRHSVRELSFFGSVTRDTFQPESDVDVLIAYEPGIRLSLWDFAAHELELTELIGREVHLTERSTIPAQHASYFLRGAVRAYAA